MMSTELTRFTDIEGRIVSLVSTSRRKGPAVQVTQGLGTAINRDEPGFIVLSPQDAYKVINGLTEWLKKVSEHQAKKAQALIEEPGALQGTIFEETGACEEFMGDHGILKTPMDDHGILKTPMALLRGTAHD
jgi:hypothetical protein